jgi:hypothetical protein
MQSIVEPARGIWSPSNYCTYIIVVVHFLDKEYALISRRYELHPASATTQCPSGHTDAHSQKKKKNYEKEKSRFSEQFLVAAAELTSPR